LGYNLPTGVINEIRQLRVYFSVNNLYTFTKFNPGYDPEIAENGINGVVSNVVGFNGGYPRPRAFSIGVNVGF
jgi:hypothetical protein